VRVLVTGARGFLGAAVSRAVNGLTAPRVDLTEAYRSTR
jgi:nucleoside-diphosphate-sugar epimerase